MDIEDKTALDAAAFLKSYCKSKDMCSYATCVFHRYRSLGNFCKLARYIPERWDVKESTVDVDKPVHN